MNARYLLGLIWLGLLVSMQSYGQPNWLPASLAHAPDTTQLWTLRHIGDSLINANQLISAKQAYQQALTMAQRTGHPGSIGLGYRAVGYWYERTGDFTLAITYYQRALNAFRKTKNPRLLAKTMLFVSFCYSQIRDSKQALTYAELGLKLAQQASLDDITAAFYSQMARLAVERKDYKQVDWYTHQESDYYKQKHDWLSYYTALFNSALTDKNRSQYVLSEQKFRQVERYAIEQKDSFMLGYVRVSIPFSLIPQNKLDEAERYARQSLQWIQHTTAATDRYTFLADVNGHLSQIAEKRGQFRQALIYYKQQVVNKDSVFNEVKNRQLSELEVRYQTQQKEDDIQQLAAANVVQTRQIWAGVGGLFVLSLLLGTMGWQNRRIQRSRAKIQQQSDQLTLMMKELHHRVKNNLAIVSSLLRLQSSRLEDEKAVQAVRTGQQRVEAMSLIHQRLYQTDQITTVNICEYLTDLAESLLQAYDYSPDDFDLIIDVEDQQLDVDVAMPLGLIANELITNAFKYAYSTTQRPLLRIALHTQNGLTLEVQDNGPGIDQARWQEPTSRASFGKRLIASLSEQLDGQVELHQQNGALFRLHVPEARLRTAA